MINKFNGSWIKFYTEFANALLKYRNNRQELIRIIKKVFESVDMKLPKLEKDNLVIDIDPFTVFALFNKNLTDLNRKKILRGFADIFSIDGYDIESFDGIPILNPLKATFYYFIDERNDKDIDNLWDLFEMALNFSDDPNQDNKNKFISCYDSVVAQKGVSWNITMGLFWIRPYLFINLDSRNREFICDKKYFPEDFIKSLNGIKTLPSGKAYLEICESVNSLIKNKLVEFNSFPELSHIAWITTKDGFDVDYYEGFWPSLQEYNPKMTVEKWLSALKDPTITNEKNLEMFKMMLELGGESTCANLAETYGNTPAHYNKLGSSFGEKVFKKFKCPECHDNGDVRYFTIPFVGKDVIEKGKERFVWKLRHELKEALKKMKMDDIKVTPVVKTEPVTIEKNTILYGPPGTGKTYNTVLYAVAIIENTTVDELKSEGYDSVKARYDNYKAEGLIEFTTFHQSFGYEEFIEGIRPAMEDDEEGSSGDIKYEIADGIFKEFCDRSIAQKHSDIGLNKNPVVWKVSLERTYDNPTRTECLDNDHIRIGYDVYGEYITDNTDFDIDGGKTVLNAFINRMRIGDIVFSCYNANEIDAIGIVTGDYKWDTDDKYEQYKRIRNVKWIVKGIRENIVDLNNSKTMTLSSVYRLSVSVEDALKLIEKYNPTFNESVESEKKNKVFIIDEINRGNISKIFGELITLIEPSKRIGAAEELRARLPYSKKNFGIPDNVYILGTMNTADRSIAALDTALRRRFSFIEMMPDTSYLTDVMIGNISVRALLEKLNERIEALYDREHTIGHAYFKEVKEDRTIHTLGKVFAKKIIPLLQEYFYEDYEKIRLILGDNQKKNEEPLFIEAVKVNDKKLFGNYSFDDEDKVTYTINDFACYDPDAYCYLG